ncbi:hypothetical protein, partial [Paucilactobacillus vaccinostercus]|uniref:hypothetical protein n=1 Tax=Paucilactobacillus vaccinostercus TaxID=176291 RepID=UPI001F27A350
PRKASFNYLLVYPRRSIAVLNWIGAFLFAINIKRLQLPVKVVVLNQAFGQFSFFRYISHRLSYPFWVAFLFAIIVK